MPAQEDKSNTLTAEKSGFEKFIQDSFLPKDIKDPLAALAGLVASASSLVGGVTAIVGIVNFASSVATFLGLNEQGPDRLQLLAERVQRIETLLTSAFKWNENAHWNELLASLESASKTLRHFLNHDTVSAGARPELLTDLDRQRLFDTVIAPLHTVLATLLPPVQHGAPAFQQAVFRQASPILDPWLFTYPEDEFEKRVDPASLGVVDLPEVEPVEWVGSVLEGGLIWDYRRAVPHILRTVTQLTIAYRLYDPAFRTTQRFHDDIADLVRDLDILAARWLSSVAWTRDLPISAEYSDADVPASYAPSAGESRSRTLVTFYTEHPEVDHWLPMPTEPEFSRLRLEYARKVLSYCGFEDFRAWVTHVRALLAIPETTESVSVATHAVGTRKFLRLDTVHRSVGSLTVKVHRVDWVLTFDIGLQPVRAPYDYAQTLPIRYSFHVESYRRASTIGGPPTELIQRQSLVFGINQRMALEVFSPDIFIPAEDDGTYVTQDRPLRPRKRVQGNRVGVSQLPDTLIVPVHFTSPPAANEKPSRLFRDVALLGIPPAGEALKPSSLSNRMLEEYSRLSFQLSGSEGVAETPPKAYFGEGRNAVVTIGYSLAVSPGHDPTDGLISFSAWTTDGVDANVGALYLVIEETPPRDPTARIRTLVPLALNPIEYWYASYSRIPSKVGFH